MTAESATAVYLLELLDGTGKIEPVRELVEIEADRPELPAALLAVWNAVDGQAPPRSGGAPDEWDRLLDAIEQDRERACDLDPTGVRYALPDGRTIEATRIDCAVLDAVTDGFLRAALWADCLPPDEYCATFQPEAWSNDYAIPVDPQGPTEWDCTAYALEHLDYLDTMAKRTADTLGGVLDGDDLFKNDPAAPEWIREWRGPFTIRVGRIDVESGGREHLTPDAELRDRARLLCARFLTRAGSGDVKLHMDVLGDPDGGHPGEYVGHTFYLDAAGHGVSFTDRAWKADDPLTAVCERLRDAAHDFPEVEWLNIVDNGDDTAGIA